MKEPEIKLFGRNIVLPDNGGAVAGEEFADEVADKGSGGGAEPEKADDEKLLEDDVAGISESCVTKLQEKDQNPGAVEGSKNPTMSSELDEDNISETHPNSQTDGQQKTLKKPDKILPCPRCNSMDTKFCYYNNYNINQPRHFCKSCQRYWTAGGTMRNVPVGAGRRKNKNYVSHCRHITISEALQAARIDPPDGFHQQAFKTNGTVLSFGPDSPLCESKASTLNLVDKRAPNKDDCSKSSATMSNSEGGEECRPQQPLVHKLNGYPYFAWPPFPWNCPLPLPAICPPGYPMPFYPAPYWNCGVPWVPPPSSTTTDQKVTSLSPISSLGKHSRNGELLKPKNSEGQEHLDRMNQESSIVVPKTLRIDDPDEAAKSSIWETLGIKYDSISREGLFKALQPKCDDKKTMVSASPVLQANPAALSRSISFQEGA